ncbi:hypothetical protein ACWPKS_17625 [Coraliomargarita sp. W4R72]
MAISLEELKQQRKQIQQHLEWLDAKISLASQESSDSCDEPTEARQTPESPATAKVPQLPPGAQLYTPPESDRPPAVEAKAEPHTEASKAELASPSIESTYKPKTQSEVLRAKVGCLVIFVLAISLFLFLLFGLPYLL